MVPFHITYICDGIVSNPTVTVQYYSSSWSGVEYDFIVSFATSVGENNLDSCEYHVGMFCPRCNAHLQVRVN